MSTRRKEIQTILPRKQFGNAPFPVHVIDTDLPLTWDNIRNALGDARGVTLCLRSARGARNRGGYFFHVEKNGKGEFIIKDFEGRQIDTLDEGRLVRFVNHVAGRRFDQEIWEYCQSVVNFSRDQTESD